MSLVTPGPVWAVVPVKGFARAKSRLAPALGVDARERLARRLADHVVDVLQSGVVDTVLVVTDGDDVASWASGRGLRVIEDGPALGAPLGAIVDVGLAEAGARGARHALVVMSDLPRLHPTDAAAMVSALGPGRLVLAPDHHGLGTNALGLSLPAVAPTAFGSADSAAGHRALAAAHALELVVVTREGLGADVDVPGDLAAVG